MCPSYRVTGEEAHSTIFAGLKYLGFGERNIVQVPVDAEGAMQIGAHTFCHMENGKEDCGTFQFAHVWQKKDGTWRITRVLSFGH